MGPTIAAVADSLRDDPAVTMVQPTRLVPAVETHMLALAKKNGRPAWYALKGGRMWCYPDGTVQWWDGKEPPEDWLGLPAPEPDDEDVGWTSPGPEEPPPPPPAPQQGWEPGEPGIVVDGGRPAMGWVASLPRDWLTMGQRFVLVALAADSFDGLTCAPGWAAVAQFTGMHESHVRKVVAQLEEPTSVRPALLRRNPQRGRGRVVIHLLAPGPGGR